MAFHPSLLIHPHFEFTAANQLASNDVGTNTGVSNSTLIINSKNTLMTLTKTEIKNNKTFKKLGFSHLDTAEIIVTLNTLLADYQVFYNKLRNFHWNIEGPEFFELHEEFEKEYNTVKKNIDIVAERIRVFGIKPNFTLKKTLELSKIEENQKNRSAIEMVRGVLKDFEILHDDILSAIGASLDTGDSATEQMLTDFLRELEKRNWMFTSYLK